MGSRLSQPRGPGGTGEASVPSKPAPRPSPKIPVKRQFNSRHVQVPIAAFTMALILFVYTRTSIRAAKDNAQRHRDADSGGEGLSLLNESRRRHGMKERLDRGSNTVTELASEMRAGLLGERKKSADAVVDAVGSGRSEEEERLRALRGRMGRKGSSGGD